MGEATLQLNAEERARSLANLKLERDAIVLYDRLAEIEKDPRSRALRSSKSRATSGGTRRSGRAVWSRLAPRCLSAAGPRAQSADDHPAGAAVRHQRGGGPGAGPGGRRGAGVLGADDARDGLDRRRRARACRDLGSPDRRPPTTAGASDRRFRAATRFGIAAVARELFARRCSVPTMAWSATCRWSWASPAPLRLLRRATTSSSSPESLACWPAPFRWPRASTSACRASASCSRTRSPWSARRCASCPRWSARSWSISTAPRACPRRRRRRSPTD